MDQEQINPLYLKGFNAGYTLNKHDPELLDSLLKSGNSNNEYFKALQAGKKQYDLEQILAKSKSNKDDQRIKKRGVHR